MARPRPSKNPSQPPRTSIELKLEESVTKALYRAKQLKDTCCNQINLRYKKQSKKFFQVRPLSVETWKELNNLVIALKFHANTLLSDTQKKLEYLSVASRLVHSVSERLVECRMVNLIHPPELNKNIELLNEIRRHIKSLESSIISRSTSDGSMK